MNQINHTIKKREKKNKHRNITNATLIEKIIKKTTFTINSSLFTYFLGVIYTAHEKIDSPKWMGLVYPISIIAGACCA